jgi:hypothetical protein
MLAAVNWLEAPVSQRKTAYGLMALMAFALVIVLGNAML